MSKKTIPISEAAQLLCVSLDTIRRWEKKGLIKGTRDANNTRIFDVDELKRAHDKYVGGDVATKFKVLKTSKKSPYKSVELFAGAGGLALGLENAGFGHELLVEIDKNAADTLKLNRPKWNVQCKDAKEVSYQGVVADIVTGGFPCQAFSFAGKKLGFITQEIGREINTLGSKSYHVELQKMVVDMKDSLEKIKEQVLNTL